jgi:hypothetical protein
MILQLIPAEMSVKYINDESSMLPIPGMGRQSMELPGKGKEEDSDRGKKGDPKKEEKPMEKERKPMPDKRK